MNREDIDCLAQEAGISTGFSVHIPKWDKPTWLFMRRFADLVAAAEREACAKVCEELDAEYEAVCQMTSVMCGQAIRARGQQ